MGSGKKKEKRILIFFSDRFQLVVITTEGNFGRLTIRCGIVFGIYSLEFIILNHSEISRLSGLVTGCIMQGSRFCVAFH